MEIKLNNTYKGTRILFSDSAKSKRTLLNKMIDILESYGYQEIMIPIIQKQETSGTSGTSGTSVSSIFKINRSH